MRTDDFELADLYAALDDERRKRQLSWSAAVREMSGGLVRRGSRPLALSTVTGLRSKHAAEGDGVLQMLCWLGRAPESFVRGAAPQAGVPLPAAPPGMVLRFDTKRLHAALNQSRRQRRLTWAQVARGARSTPASLMGLSKGGRTGFPHVVRVTRWLGMPVASFVRFTSR